MFSNQSKHSILPQTKQLLTTTLSIPSQTSILPTSLLSLSITPYQRFFHNYLSPNLTKSLPLNSHLRTFTTHSHHHHQSIGYQKRLVQNKHSTSTSSPHTISKRFKSLRDDFNNRAQRDEERRKQRLEKRAAAGGQLIPGVEQGTDPILSKEVQLLAKLFPDKKVTPYDPQVVAIREQVKKDGLQIKNGQLYSKDGQLIELPGQKKKDTLLGKMDKKFGGSWFIGRLSPWQIVMVITLIIGFVYAGRQHKQRTESLPQKRAAKPMIDFIRTTTLIKYVWTLRLMLEVGALVPIDGTENLADQSLQEEIEKELVEISEDNHAPSHKDDHLARKLKEHPDIKRNMNYISAIYILDNELHELDKELRQSLLDLMELYVSLGRPYADNYDPQQQSVDAIFSQSQSTISLSNNVDEYLLKHEKMKDALQVLFTRQNSAHRHYGQMFSDIYALTWLKAGIWNLPKDDRVLIPEEIQFYIQSIGYDIVRVWQDNYVHELGKKLHPHLHRLAFPSEIVDFGLQNDHRSQSIEPFVRELRKIDPKVIADYNDFLDYNLNISLTDNYKRWWRRMLQNMPRFRRANKPPPTITLSNYTQLFRDYERIFGKVPYLALVSKEVNFLEHLKDFSLGNQNLQDAMNIITEMQTTSRLDHIPKSQYSVEAVVDGAKDKLKELMDNDFHTKLSEMSYIDEKQEVELVREHEKRVKKRQRDMKKHQHTLSILSIPTMIRTRYLYNLLDIGSPVLQIVKDHLGTLEQQGIYFPLYPCVGSFRDFYHTIAQSAQVLCQRDQQLVELKKQLGQVYRALEPNRGELSEEMKQRFLAREKELLAVPDIREYALSMTREEIARDEQFIYGKTAGLFDLDEDKQKMNIFNEFEDDLTPNHPINRGERGKIQYQIVIPDPPKHISHAIWMLDSYVDVRPGRPDHGEDRRAFAARKFNSIRSFMPIPSRYIPQSSIEILQRGQRDNIREMNMNTKDGTQEETLSQKQVRKAKLDHTREKAQQSISQEEWEALENNKIERLHAIAGANLVKLEACIIQNLIELNSWGIEIRIPLDGLKPNQFKHYIQPPYAVLERETITTSLDGLGPINPTQTFIPTRASLVISGKHKLLDKYQQDLLTLQQKGFQITPAIVIDANSQQQQIVAPQHIPSATDIAKSGLTPAEYYTQHNQKQHQQLHQTVTITPTSDNTTNINPQVVETIQLLQDSTRLKDDSIAIGFPSMSTEHFSQLQTQLDQQQFEQYKKNPTQIVPPTGKNIQQIASTAQEEINKNRDNESYDIFKPLPGKQLTLEEQRSQQLLLPVPLTPTNIPSLPSDRNKFIQEQQSKFSYRQGENIDFPQSFNRAGYNLDKIERETEHQQTRQLVQKLSTISDVDTGEPMNIKIPNDDEIQYQAPK